MPEASKLENYQKLLQQLLAKSLTLSLGTINQQRQAEVSLVPFLYHMDCFWVFVSELSKHTQHLIDHPDVSVLVCNIESKVINPFSIERLSVACQAELENNTREDVLDLMTSKLGKTVSLLRQLGDFQLFKLKPINGRLIAGFGQAFDVDFSKMSLAHVDGSNAS